MSNHTNGDTHQYIAREAEESILDARMTAEHVHIMPHERPVESARLREIGGAALTQWLEVRLRDAFYAGRASIEREKPELWEMRKVSLRRLYVSLSKYMAKEFSCEEERPIDPK